MEEEKEELAPEAAGAADLTPTVSLRLWTLGTVWTLGVHLILQVLGGVGQI